MRKRHPIPTICNKSIFLQGIHLSVANVCMGKDKIDVWRNRRYWLRLYVKARIGTERVIEEIFYKIHSVKRIDELIQHISCFYDVNEYYDNEKGEHVIGEPMKFKRKQYWSIDGRGKIYHIQALETYFQHGIAAILLYPYSMFPNTVNWNAIKEIDSK
jgi:hypothetical protein